MDYGATLCSCFIFEIQFKNLLTTRMSVLTQEGSTSQSDLSGTVNLLTDGQHYYDSMLRSMIYADFRIR